VDDVTAGVERFARALTTVEEALDWAALGASYCEGEAGTFFGVEQIENLRETGLHFASDLGEALRPGGTSLYVGAGVAELVPILFEAAVLERKVAVHTADAREAGLLNAAFAGVELEGLRPRWSTKPIGAGGGWSARGADAVDHLWFVSVATDPDHFPAHNHVLYELEGDRPGRLGPERERIDALLDQALTPLRPPALLCTTREELPLVEERCARFGLDLTVPDVGRLSGLVGDAVYACRVKGR
jgi:hypothetical protein